MWRRSIEEPRRGSVLKDVPRTALKRAANHIERRSPTCVCSRRSSALRAAKSILAPYRAISLARWSPTSSETEGKPSSETSSTGSPGESDQSRTLSGSRFTFEDLVS
jgi:hypothetical protein